MDMPELFTLLQESKLNLRAFGQGKAKTLLDLLTEIQSGEAVLEKVRGRLTRRLTVLGVDVYAEVDSQRLRLVEDRQVFTDGRVRRRSTPTAVSEKLHQDEDVSEAVPRALKEELGIASFEVVADSWRERVETEESPSYPGLLSEYTKLEVDVIISPSEYKEEGYQEEQRDKTTHFKWVAAN